MSASRTPLENLNGLVVILATFFAATQVFNLVTPESGLPFLLFNVFLFVLLVNTLAGSPDRVSVLRSMAVIVGAAFILKFIVLAAIVRARRRHAQARAVRAARRRDAGHADAAAAASGCRLYRVRDAGAVSDRACACCPRGRRSVALIKSGE